MKYTQRRFSPSSILRPLKEIQDIHIKNTKEIADFTPKWKIQDEKLWACIYHTVNEMDLTLGSIQIFRHLRLIEDLHDLGIMTFSLAGTMLMRPICEDLMERDGFISIIEDLFLSHYKIAPTISREPGNTVVVTCPPPLTRLITGYPSPYRVQRDFNDLVKGIESFIFQCDIHKSSLEFSIELTQPDDEAPLNENYMQAAQFLIKMAETSA